MKAYKETLTLPTYPTGPANVNPILAEYRDEKPYPYPMIDQLTDECKDVDYQALVLENEYLKLIVLPELGGKIYSVTDKRNGEPLFYENRVVKPQLVGLTGAWTSGGIEFNFPFGHRPTAMDEIDTDIRENQDGTVSVFVGETDHISGVRFSVELKLKPGNAAMEETVRIYNPSSLPQRYFFWNTASYPETVDLECRYPVQWMIEEHGRRRRPWPMNDLVDVRESRNIQQFSSVFTAYADEDYFGVFNRKKAVGNVHIANHREVPGKKFWTWGMAEHGIRWNLSLTDEDGCYMEHQAGDTETQYNYHDFLPYQKLEWQEYWYQVFDMEPFTYANEAVVLALRSHYGKEEEMAVSILANAPLGDCEFRIVHDGEIIFERKTGLSPERTVYFKAPITLQHLSQGQLRFELEDASGEIIAEDILHRSPSLDEELDASEDVKPDRDELTSKLVQIRTAEERRKFSIALQGMDELLASHPDYLEMHIRKTVILLQMGRLEEAERTIHAASKLMPYDDNLLYYYGAVRFLRGKTEPARRSFLSVHSASPMFPASQVMLGKLALVRNEWRKAGRYFALALQGGADTADVLEVHALRKMGDRRQALHKVNRIVERDPLCITARLEQDLLSGNGQSHRFFNKNIHDALHLLQFYEEIGDAETQKRILDQFEQKQNPIFLYHQGYWHSRTGDKEAAMKGYRSAESQSCDLVFPSHSLSLSALLDADQALVDESLHTKYYLGLAYYSRERWEEAREAWTECVNREFRYSVLYRNLGYLLWRRLDEPETAISVLEHGRSLEPHNPEIPVLLNGLYQLTDRREARENLLSDHVPIERMSQAEARMRISLYNEMEQFDRAWEILSQYKFRNWEADYPGMDVRDMYHDTRFGRTVEWMRQERWDEAVGELEQSMSYPDNLGIGLLADQSFVREWYLLSVCCERQGRIAQALEYCNRIVAKRVDFDDPDYAYYIKAAHKKAHWEWFGFAGKE